MSVPFADELSLRFDFYNDFTIIIYIYDDENVPGRAGVGPWSSGGFWEDSGSASSS